MDKNKLKVLQDIGYRIRLCCGNCVHGTFPQNEWGTCAARQYEHQKHTGEARQLSIHKTGCCGQHKLDEAKKAQLGAFAEFIDGERTLFT